jgi:hypothetical protein
VVQLAFDDAQMASDGVAQKTFDGAQKTSDGAQTALTNEIQKVSYDETWTASAQPDDAKRPQTGVDHPYQPQSQGTAPP